LSHDLWWNGPPLLKRASTTWPKRDPAMSVDTTTEKEISIEARTITVHHVDCAREWELPKRYSSWTQLVRVTAYVLRFVENSTRKKRSLLGKKLSIDVFELAKSSTVDSSKRLTSQKNGVH